MTVFIENDVELELDLKFAREQPIRQNLKILPASPPNLMSEPVMTLTLSMTRNGNYG